jgi:hypothetical protein
MAQPSPRHLISVYDIGDEAAPALSCQWPTHLPNALATSSPSLSPAWPPAAPLLSLLLLLLPAEPLLDLAAAALSGPSGLLLAASAGSSPLAALHSAACSSDVPLEPLTVDSSVGARLAREVLRGSSRLPPAAAGHHIMPCALLDLLRGPA